LNPTNIPTITISYQPSSQTSSLIPTNIPTWIQTNTSLKFDMSIQFHNFKNPKPDQKDTQIIIVSTSKTMNISTNYISLKPQETSTKISRITILNYDIIVNLQIKIPMKGENGLILYNSLIHNFKTAYNSGDFIKTILKESQLLNITSFINSTLINMTFSSPIIIYNSYSPTLMPTQTTYNLINTRNNYSDETIIILSIFASICGISMIGVIAYLYILYKKHKNNIQLEQPILNLDPLDSNAISIIVEGTIVEDTIVEDMIVEGTIIEEGTIIHV